MHPDLGRISRTKNRRSRLTALSLIWFLWDIKEPTPLFEKSRGRRPRWRGQPFLGWVGYLFGETLILGKLHDPPSGVVMATCKQCLYVIKVLTSFLIEMLL